MRLTRSGVGCRCDESLLRRVTSTADGEEIAACLLNRFHQDTRRHQSDDPLVTQGCKEARKHTNKEEDHDDPLQLGFCATAPRTHVKTTRMNGMASSSLMRSRGFLRRHPERVWRPPGATACPRAP
eukprot:6488068-Amphidinium_carterae.1